MLKFFIFFILLFSKSSCNNNKSSKEVSQFIWVYDSGVRFRNIDVINLKEGKGKLYKIFQDTLYANNLSFAIIKSFNAKKSELILKSLTSDSIGKYYDINIYSGR
jgi:hypothetical protein